MVKPHWKIILAVSERGMKSYVQAKLVHSCTICNSQKVGTIQMSIN